MTLPAAFLDRPIAHRGLHDRAAGVIENSRAAFEAAIAGGYGIELDLQLSADGEAMVFHDYDLKRLTGQPGHVRARTAAELRAMALTGASASTDGAAPPPRGEGLGRGAPEPRPKGRGRGEGVAAQPPPSDPGDTIPTLAEILTFVAGRVPLLIEIKDQSLHLTETDGALERRTADLLNSYDGPAALMSFNPHAVAHLRDAAPAIPRGRVTSAFAEDDWPFVAPARRAALAKIADLAALDASFISHQHDQLSDDTVTAAAGRSVLCWTIRSPVQEQAARRHAANITFEGYRP